MMRDHHRLRISCFSTTDLAPAVLQQHPLADGWHIRRTNGSLASAGGSANVVAVENVPGDGPSNAWVDPSVDAFPLRCFS